MTDEKTELVVPFEIPEGSMVLRDGPVKDKDGNFKRYFSVHAPADACQIPDGKNYIRLMVSLTEGVDKESATTMKVPCLMRKDGSLEVEARTRAYLNFPPQK